MKITIVSAIDQNSFGIGKDNKLCWNDKEDLSYFKNLTTNSSEKTSNVIVMGRKTYESIGKPLSNRINVIVSKTLSSSDVDDGFVIYNSLSKVIDNFSSEKNIFIIGGHDLYKECLDKNIVDEIHLTLMNYKNLSFDTYFPKFDYSKYSVKEWKTIDENKSRVILEKNNQFNEENQYLSLIFKIILENEKKVIRSDRTGTGTLSIFAPNQMRFSLRNNSFPLLTTKKTFFRGIAEELLWFLSGSTNVNLLSEKGVKIWDFNSSREFLDSLGLNHRQVGDAGPIYGHSWRHYGAEYIDCSTDYTDKGFDQIKFLIEELKKNPFSRRLILNSWNPSVLKEVVLPPCHCMAQFYVKEENNKKMLSLQFYQRSADLGLGVPFNIASYALLLKMFAHCVDMEADELIYIIGDAHVYSNHVEPLKEQLTRKPFPFPKLMITGEKDIFSLKYSDFKLINYESHGTVKMEMS